MLPEQIKKFVDALSSLPGIGPRQAARLAFYMVNRGKTALSNLESAVSGLKDVKICENCFFIHSNPENLCHICLNSERSPEIVMIVEKETQLISMEKTRKYFGRYLVLGESDKSGTLNPSQKTRLEKLKSLAGKKGSFEEIIIATNPTTYGDLSAFLIKKELTDAAKKITRLGRGIPSGGEIEFADEETLGEALRGRN